MGASKTEERVKEVSSSSSDSGSEDEQQDSPQQEQQGGDGSPSRSRISRNEKKARKAVLRHGMKQVPDIVKVVLRKAKQVCRRTDDLFAPSPSSPKSFFYVLIFAGSLVWVRFVL